MKLILKYYSGDEYEGGDTIIPFEHDSLEDAEYEFLLKLEETRDGVQELTKWVEDNYPLNYHKTTRDAACIEYMEKYRAFFDPKRHRGVFTFCGRDFHAYDIGDDVTFLSLDDWFEQNKLK